MLFKDIIDGRFKVFARMKDEEKSRNIGVVKYVETLASLSGVNILNWDCMAIFGSGAGNKLIDEKNEINRLFFNEVERIAVAAPAVEGELLTEAMKQQIKAAETRHITSLLAAEQRLADDQLRVANTRYKDYETHMKKAGEHNANIRRLSHQSSNMEDQIRQVIASPFWEFNGIDRGTKITFVTRGDVHISHRNEAAGININLNFGRFKVQFDMVDFSLRVFPHERNINSHGYCHPHISAGSGGICWGTAASTATRLLATASFVEPMMLLATILANYNSASPYHTIERFQDAVGTPEEHFARDSMTEQRDEVRAAMAPLDSLELNIDAHRQEAPPEAAAIENAPTEPVAAETPVEATTPLRRRARSAARTTTNSIVITTTANTPDEISF